MNVKTRPTLSGMLAVAAAGIFAAGTVADRANTLFGETDAKAPVSPARHVYAAINIDCPRKSAEAACREELLSD